MTFGKSDRKFVYEKREVENVISRSRESTNQRDSFIKNNFKFFKLKDNAEHTIRPLPPTWHKDNIPKQLVGMASKILTTKGKPTHWGIDVWVHYRVGSDENTYLCLEKMLDLPCPICEDRKTSTNAEYIKSLTPSRRVLQYIIDRDNEKEGPMLWSPPFSVDKDILSISTDPKQGIARTIDDPDTGYDVSFHVEGTKPMIKYKAFKLSFSDCVLSESKEKMNTWLEYITANPLPTVLEFHDYDKIYKAHHGGQIVTKNENVSVEHKEEMQEQNNDEQKQEVPEGVPQQETHKSMIKPVPQESKPMTASEMLRAKFKKN